MYFEQKLPEIFESINESLSNSADQKEEEDKFIEKVSKLLLVWNEWVIFDHKFLLGLEALLRKRLKNSENSDKKLLEFDTSTQTGIKLKCLEEDLKSQTFQELERVCRANGLPVSGSKPKLIERLLTLEEFRIKGEKSNELTGEADALRKQAARKNEKAGPEAGKPLAKNTLSLIKSFKSIDNRCLTESSSTEIDGFCKVYLAVLKLLQSRNERFDTSDLDGLEFDEIDEYIHDLKKKISIFEGDNIDGG